MIKYLIRNTSLLKPDLLASLNAETSVTQNLLAKLIHKVLDNNMTYESVCVQLAEMVSQNSTALTVLTDKYNDQAASKDLVRATFQ